MNAKRTRIDCDRSGYITLGEFLVYAYRNRLELSGARLLLEDPMNRAITESISRKVIGSPSCHRSGVNLRLVMGGASCLWGLGMPWALGFSCVSSSGAHMMW